MQARKCSSRHRSQISVYRQTTSQTFLPNLNTSRFFKCKRKSNKVLFVVSDRLWYRLGGLGAQRVTFRGYSMSTTHSQPPSTLSSISATCGLRPKYANLLKTLGIWIKRAASFTQFDHNSDEFGARNIYLRPNGSAPVKLEPHQSRSRSRSREECKISPWYW